MNLVVRLLLVALGVYVAAEVVPGVDLAPGAENLVVVTLVFSAVNLLVRPLVRLLSLPFVLLTLGLFLLVVNAAMFGLAAALTPRLDVDGVVPALLGALVVSAVTWVAERVLRVRR